MVNGHKNKENAKIMAETFSKLLNYDEPKTLSNQYKYYHKNKTGKLSTTQLHLKNFKTTKASSENNVFTEILEYSDSTIHKFGTQNISLKNGLGLGL